MNTWKIIYLNHGERFKNINDHCSYINNLKLKSEKNSGLNRVQTRDLCNTGAVLHQLSYKPTGSWSHCGHSQCDQLPFGLIAPLVERCASIADMKMPKVGQNMSENAFYGLFFTLPGGFVIHMGDQEIWGTYHLHGKTGNSSWKIKWFAPFRLGSFRKYGMWFEVMLSFWSF